MLSFSQKELPQQKEAFKLTPLSYRLSTGLAKKFVSVFLCRLTEYFSVLSTRPLKYHSSPFVPLPSLWPNKMSSQVTPSL